MISIRMYVCVCVCLHLSDNCTAYIHLNTPKYIIYNLRTVSPPSGSLDPVNETVVFQLGSRYDSTDAEEDEGADQRCSSPEDIACDSLPWHRQQGRRERERER